MIASPVTSFKELSSPLKSRLDKKNYSVIQLPNGLIALLISDAERYLANSAIADHCEDAMNAEPYSDAESTGDDFDDDNDDRDCNKSLVSDSEDDVAIRKAKANTKYLAAAALCVGVGSFEDLPEVPGLMHFLEHMVFMGCEKYPEENSYEDFISKHGGYSNAYTDMEETVFYFEILEKHFKEAIDRLAQFFISPLIKVEAMQREREAVHSEYQLALPKDGNRSEQLFASIAKKGHPMGTFTWGSEETLSGNISDLQLNKKLHEIQEHFYSAPYMTFAVQSRDTLEDLTHCIVSSFSKVPNSGIPRPRYEDLGFPFRQEDMHKLYKVIPVSDFHSVRLIWALPPLLEEYKVKPLHYMGHVLGDEGKGSVLSYLKNKAWAVDLSAGNDGSGFDFNSTYASFTVTVVLTDEGFNNIPSVILTVFQYLKLMQDTGPVEAVFKDLQSVEELNFEYFEESHPMDNVEKLARNMQFYPPKDYLTGDSLLFEYNPEVISYYMNMITPENCLIMLHSKLYELNMDVCLTEKWFGTKYAVEEIPQQWKEYWKSSPTNTSLHLPSKNPFIPDEFDILEPDLPVSSFPELLIKEECGELWFCQDKKFLLPKACTNIYLLTDLVYHSPRMAAMLELYIYLLNYHIMEDIYPAKMTQYNCYLKAKSRGLLIHISGYNQKLSVCFNVVLDHILNFVRYLNEDAFIQIKEEQLKRYYNTILQPSKVLKDLRLYFLCHVYWPVHEKLEALKDITYESLINEFATQFLPSCHIRMLLQGNMTASQAKSLYGSFRNVKTDITLLLPFPHECAMAITFGERIVQVRNFNENDTNSSVVCYYQGSPGCLKTEVMNQLIQLLMEEPVVDILRTKEQLGYDVSCTDHSTFGVLGMSVTIQTQANKFTTTHVDERVEEFLKYFMEKVENMSDHEFNAIKETLVGLKQTVDLTLQEEFSRNWQEIVHEEHCFDRFSKQINILRDLTKDDLLKWLRRIFIRNGNKEFQKLSVHVIGCQDPQEENVPSLKSVMDTVCCMKCITPDIFSTTEMGSVSDRYITDISAHKKSLQQFPIIKIR